MKQIVIVGCGYLGRRLTRRYLAQKVPVLALVRSQSSVDSLRAEGISARILDLDGRYTLDDLSLDASGIFYLAPPPSQGVCEPRLRRFLASISGQCPTRLVLISTSGVYGDCGGAWIDEGRPVNPQVDRAYRRWDGEQALADWASNRDTERVVLRVAGIYGPGRLPLDRLRSRAPVLELSAAPFTNRVHVVDLVQACEAAMSRGQDGGLYHVCDGQPGTMNDYFNQVAVRAGLPAPPEISAQQAESQLSVGMRSYMAESRRLSNRRLRHELGVQLRFPTLAQGLDDCFSPD